ncbi:YlaI family protein [Staphylococcus simulans]|uniref:YlaI family protein n=1 Tax=Staphylococcus simulans TaxID=1286 RepID=UPI0021D19C12|nr:YlaI family protein [Staphylococcus simulans]UXR49338.1 YlaI family protein [Staphylococcus simulans]
MIKVQCIICDTEVLMDENTLEAKQLRNHPMRTFMCEDCRSRLNVPKQRNNFYKAQEKFNILTEDHDD